MKKLGYVLFSMLAIALVVSGTAMAQNNTNTGGDNSTFFVTYYANNVAAAPDETVRIINDGDQGAPQPAGDLFADLFVFDDSEELVTCCGCVVTPDGLLSESVKKPAHEILAPWHYSAPWRYQADLVFDLLGPELPQRPDVHPDHSGTGTAPLGDPRAEQRQQVSVRRGAL